MNDPTNWNVIADSFEFKSPEEAKRAEGILNRLLKESFENGRKVGERDGQRLDWIEAKRPTISYADATPDSPSGPHVCAYPENPTDFASHFFGDSFRDVIDKAMKATSS